MENGLDFVLVFYQNYKYYHFFAACFGLGCALSLYRPFRSLMVPLVLAVFFTVTFEIFGIMSGVPAHRSGRGGPYDRTDVCCGFCVALLVSILNLNLFHVYTLSYGCGLVGFALCGVARKSMSLWRQSER